MTKTSNAPTSEDKNILVVDDTPRNLAVLSDLLSKNGYQVSTAISAAMALTYLEHHLPHLILLDIRMPEMDGFEFCQIIKASPRTTKIPVIFISALSETEDKINAFKLGGVDYITKPFQAEEVLARLKSHSALLAMQNRLREEVEERKQAQQKLEQAYHQIEEVVKERTLELEALKEKLEQENTYLREEIKTTLHFGEIVGESKTIRKSLNLVQQVAGSDTSVLILGETGTGKELIARALHNNSQRKNRPLVKVNCAAIPSNLIESELFGHEKGAFTGALTRKIGRFELADRGTIFLDEIGDLPLELQAKLLRVLQEGEFERLGNSSTMKVDVRVIAATNRNLNELRKEGRFRDDLFFRLSVFPIECPPLRERLEDIPILVQHFIRIFNKKLSRNISSVPQKILALFKEYHWPGNIRELENIIERATILSSTEELELGDGFMGSGQFPGPETIPTLDESQIQHISHVLRLTDGKIRGKGGAAEILDIKPTTLESRMKKLGIQITRTSDIS